jgi:hypothetical protein
MNTRRAGITRFSRRTLLAGAAALAGLRYSSGPVAADDRAPRQASPGEDRFALPGPFRGRVVEVNDPRSVVDQAIHAETVRGMMERGMRELTGAATEEEAWTRFFRPGERVGIKVCPVGRPSSISQPETLLEVIRGLSLAGIRNEDIVLFDRYADDFRECGFDRILPRGVRWAGASPRYDDLQTALDGYDPENFVEMPRVVPGEDPEDPINRRSHLCTLVSREVDRLVNVCVLKDHASSGVTMALKNMSHGFVNNVSRSHSRPDLNWCDTFIPAVVAMPTIRRKVVLHVGDGLIGTYDGGPGSWNPHFRTWEHGSLFFATDPVAMDRVAWHILDAKRRAEGLPALAETGMEGKNPGHESFSMRQPEHVLLAGEAGLGEADLKKIEHRILRQ